MSITMRPSDLGELYGLLTMYQQAYGGIGEEFFLEVRERYAESAHFFGCTEEIPLITNPRAAGRKRKSNPEEVQKILELRKKGMTIRKIAVEMGCSVGLVHKLINEHYSRG